MMLRTDLKDWEVEEIRDIKGLEFSVALRFKTKNYWCKQYALVFPLASETEQNEIWQVNDNEFVIFNNPEIYHISILPGTSIKTFYRASAKMPRSLFDGKFFCYEDVSGYTHVYSVPNRGELRDLIRDFIDPDIKVVIKNAEDSVVITVKAPNLTHSFDLSLLADDFDLTNVLGVDFVLDAKERCKEVRVAKYYEKCGGYYLGNSSMMAQGVFTENNGQYEYSPDDFFRNVATRKLLTANNLSPGLPSSPCVFLKGEVDDDEYLIKPSHEVLIIEDKKNHKTYGLEMYGERCIGVMRTGENDFLALTESLCDAGEHLVDCPDRLRGFVRTTAGKFLWNSGAFNLDSHAVVRADRCQLDDDTIVFATDEDYNAYSSFEMWSISKNRRANPLDEFDALKKATTEPYVCHMERQIMVKYRNHPQWKAWPMIVVRLYAPKEYCDIFALINPNKKYRIHGKVYNMLADSMVEGPKTIYGLVKMFNENRELKLKYSL